MSLRKVWIVNMSFFGSDQQVMLERGNCSITLGQQESWSRLPFPGCCPSYLSGASLTRFPAFILFPLFHIYKHTLHHFAAWMGTPPGKYFRSKLHFTHAHDHLTNENNFYILSLLSNAENEKKAVYSPWAKVLAVDQHLLQPKRP